MNCSDTSEKTYYQEYVYISTRMLVNTAVLRNRGRGLSGYIYNYTRDYSHVCIRVNTVSDVLRDNLLIGQVLCMRKGRQH